MRIAALAVVFLASFAAHAANVYPDKPIRLIVPFAPGGGADITARAVAQKLAAAWGQQIIID
ncbi:MAG: tripartite tricarboxylate transporter substrate binding protein, partial [Betaproteobacteria bacterium]